MTDIVLATLPGESEGERVLMVLCQTEGQSRVELRQQTFGAGIGWFNQSTVTLQPHQVADLRNALGVGHARSATMPRAMRRPSQEAAWSPRVIGETA